MRIQTLARSLAATTGLALVLMASPAQAQVITPGSLSDARDSVGNPNQLSISNPNATTANVTVLAPVVVSNWYDFNVPQNTTLNLGSATGTSSLLARVIGGGFSDLSGTVNANDVNLWLINQNGILFGSNSSINTGSFLASTLDLADADYFDFYNGTNAAGNGANSVNFLTNPASTTIIASPTGANFAAQRGLLFISPSLNLSGNFNAGSGAASFVAATDVSVNFSAGSPLSYTVNKGTTVATQTIGGSVAGREAQFVFRNASTLSNGMLTINANVATTATATARGILLSTSSEAGNDAALTANGTLTSTGSVSADVTGDLRFNNSLSGSALTLTASKALVAGNLSATAGGVAVQGSSLSAGNVNATGDINYSTGGTASFSSLSSTGGAVTVNGFVPSGLSIAGNVMGTRVYLLTNGALSVGNITSTAGDASVLAYGAGSIAAGSVSATGGSVALFSVGPMTAGGLTATGSILAQSGNGGAVSLGNLDAGTTITLDTTGSLGLGSARSGGTFKAGSLVDPSSITANGPIVASDVDIDSTGNMSLGNVTATGGNIDLDAGGGLTGGALSATGLVSVDTPGAVQLASVLANSDGIGAEGVAVGTTIMPSSITVTGATSGGSVRLATSSAMQLGNVSSTAGAVDLDSSNGGISAGTVSATGGNATLTAPGAITTTAIGSSAVVDVDSTGGGNLNLGNLNAGTTIHLDTSGSARLGSATAGGAFAIGASVDPASITATGNISAGSVDFDAAGLLDAQNITATAGAIDIDTGSVQARALSATNGVTVDAAGPITLTSVLGDGDSNGTGVVVIGGLTTPSTLSISGIAKGVATVLRASGAVSLGNVTSTAGVIDIDSTNGAISAGTLSATGGDALVTARGGVTTGSIASTGAIDVDSTSGGALSLGNLRAGTGTALDTVGALSFGSVNAPTAPFFIGASSQPSSIISAGVINVASLAARTSGALSLSGANTIGQIDDVTAGGSILINNVGATTIAGNVTSTSDITLTSGDDLTIASTGGVVGGLVALSAVGNFINNSGSDAVTASDHWVIYSNAPAGNVFGGLDSGNTALWNATLATQAPGTISGNRYVFAYQPTLTVASTDASKVYGTDLTGMLDGYYTASGLQPGVAGAYQGDTLASILSGAPSITSAGAVANADVAGSPYAMNIAQGSLGVSNGYALVLTSSGKLTVTPKAITASVNANDKTYDGTTAATGTVTLNGTLAGDDIGTGGSTFTFSDKNVGTDKTVTVSGTALTGADAGNYTLTVPASTLADIFARAINASVAANSKTYDGTTAANGTVTLNGVVAGDSVGTSGTVFTFSDKNAGTNKTVTITGTTLTGADAGNYTLAIPATTLADIFAKAISAAIAANSKTYDGTTAATGTVTLSGVVAGDNVGTTGTTFTFSDKNVGKDKTVTVSGTTLTGADAGNYTLTLPATTLADIFAKAITATVTANNKTYDGTTAASGNVTLNGVIAGDSVGTTGAVFTFSNKNAGTNKTVSVTGAALSGADAGNYTVTFPTSTLASILQRALQITADDQVKLRDSADPALTYTVGGQGLVAGDTLSGALTREPGEALGDYAIGQGTLSAGSNYTVSYAPGTLSIVRDPLADAAAAGQNALRALPLPSDTATQRGAVLLVDVDALCPPESKDCRID